jgi:hypothetical protein
MLFKNQAKNDRPRRADERGPKRNDGAKDTNLGHSGGLPGSGADLASQDMEVPNPSPS